MVGSERIEGKGRGILQVARPYCLFRKGQVVLSAAGLYN
jgi:hypothetical protein